MSHRVEVVIDELVLVGFRREDRYDIAAGLERELALQLVDPALAARLPASGASGPGLRAPDARLRHAARANDIGAAAGRAIADGMRR